MYNESVLLEKIRTLEMEIQKLRTQLKVWEGEGRGGEERRG